MKINPIIITTGNINSIFFEIFFKSLKKKIESPIILISNKDLLIKNLKKFNYQIKFKIISEQDVLNGYYVKNTINLIDIDLKTSIIKSKNLIERLYIKKSFELAFKLIRKKVSNKFLNGPINKKNFLNKKYLGITEYLAKNFNQKDTGMLIYNKELSVCPLTTHLPIKLVSKKITKTLIIDRLIMINDFFMKNFKLKPKIAVTGLNPHCESILNYNEDDKIVLPAINFAKKKGILASGPYAADTVFLKQNRKKYNIVLGMYHDQVLTPLKTLFEYDAVNITMGLPFLRVSPDHGPNEKMVNKNLSNPTSLAQALKFLDKI